MLRLRSSDALLITDVQNDFLPGGALGVRGGDQVIAPINRMIAEFHSCGFPIYASRDWHPSNHCSFEQRGGPWPPHAVAGTPGARFSDELRLPGDAHVISKATDPDQEAYSAFQGTRLSALLRREGVRRIFLAGLTTDYCVLESVRDARRGGFEVVVLEDTIRAVDVHPGDGERAKRKMRELGAELVQTDQVLAAQSPPAQTA